jgi:hypothetical protein
MFGSALWGGGSSTTATPSGTPLKPLLYLALRLAGVTRGPQRTPSPAQFADALAQANLLISAWNVNGRMIFTSSIAVYDLTSGKKTYTIGPGGEIDTTRPQRIVGATLLFPTSPVVRKTIRCTEDDGLWRRISVQDISGGVPDILYNDGGNPLSTLYLFPQPGDGYQLELYTWQLLSGFASVDDTLILPPGYDNALTYTLAVRLNSTFKEVAGPLDPEVKRESVAAMAAIREKNAKCPRMDTGGDHDNNGGWYDYLSGGSQP